MEILIRIEEVIKAIEVVEAAVGLMEEDIKTKEDSRITKEEEAKAYIRIIKIRHRNLTEEEGEEEDKTFIINRTMPFKDKITIKVGINNLEIKVTNNNSNNLAVTTSLEGEEDSVKTNNRNSDVEEDRITTEEITEDKVEDTEEVVGEEDLVAIIIINHQLLTKMIQ